MALLAIVASVGGCEIVFPLDGPRDAAPDAFSSRYAEAVLADVPVGYWRLGDSTRAAADVTGNNVGTYTGEVELETAGAIIDDPDASVTFGDGDNAFVDIGNTFAFEGTAAFSIELWANRSVSSSSFSALVNKTDESGGGNVRVGYHLNSTNNVLNFERNDGTKIQDVRTAELPIGNWTHVVVTFDQDKLRLFIDGELKDTSLGVAIPVIPATVKPFVIGARNGGEYGFFTGSIDEVAIYDHALDIVRIDAHHTIGLGQ